MNTGMMLALFALISAFVSIYYGIRIANYLRARGFVANPLFIRWMIFNYVAKYKRITFEETGEVGPLYSPCVTSAAIAAVFALGAIFTLTG